MFFWEILRHDRRAYVGIIAALATSRIRFTIAVSGFMEILSG